MEEESFIGAFGDVPTDLAGDYSQLYIFRAEDFGAWYRRVRDAHEREVDGGMAGMTDAQLAEHGLCRIGSAAMWDELRDMKDRELSEEHGLVRLPVDADGVPIRIGDVMEWVDIEGTVEVVCTVDAVGVDCFFAWDAANCRYAQKDANAYRHHRPPTVEDVLAEFADKVCNSGHQWGLDAKDTIAEYAAKLRLVGDGE